MSRTDQPSPESIVGPSYATQAAWRLLYIEEDEVDALKLKLTLRDDLPAGSTVDYAHNLEQGDELLNNSAYDAVLYGLGSTDSRSLAALKQFAEEYDDTPVIVLSNDTEQRAAVAVGRAGASSFLLKSKLTSDQLLGVLRHALEYSSYEGELPDRRKEPRYPLEAAAIIFPIEANGKPGPEIPAMTADISLGGLVIVAEHDSERVPDICLVGVEGHDGVYRYATVEWRHRRLALPAVRFGGRFLRRHEDPFHPSRLTPRFDSKEYRFQTALDPSVLKEWVARGIVQPRVIDRVLSCPKCDSLPTFRFGCPQCGSADTKSTQLIHHFACAHVAPAETFAGKTVSCPKCRTNNLIVGADFEYLKGPSLCRDCSWSEGDLDLIAECLQCGNRFAGDEAVEREVFEYHVDRLDPLAFIDRA